MKELISSELVHAICWTLLHSLWQGLLAAVVAAIIIIATKRTKAIVRYNLLSFLFVIFLAASTVTFLRQPGILPGLQAGNHTVVHFTTAYNPASPATTPGSWLPVLQKESFYRAISYYGNQYATVITGTWALLFLLHFLKLLAGLHYVHRIRNQQIVSPDEKWKEQLEAMKKRLHIRTAVAFLESGLIKVPVVVGFLKPVILVPLGMLSHLSPDQVQTILLHELAHIRRRDFMVNVLQRLAECIFFFNPFITWLSSRIREEREACCDDIVMEHIPDKRSYLEALVSFRQPEFPADGYTMALGGNNKLLNRVKRMITQENKKLNAMEKLTLIFFVLAITAFSFIPDKEHKAKKQRARTPQKETAGILGEAQPVFTIIAADPEPAGRIATDTVPVKKLTFTNISSVINDDGKNKSAAVTAVANDGKTYSYRLENDELTDLAVDGVKIKKENFDRYTGIIDKIEASRKERSQSVISKQLLDLKGMAAGQQLQLAGQADLNNNLLRLAQQNNAQAMNLHKQFEAAQLQLANNLQLAQGNAILAAREPLQAKELLALQDSIRQEYGKTMLAREQNALSLINLQNQLNLEQPQAALAAQDIQFHSSDFRLASIIAGLAEEGIIESDTSIPLAFTLNADELIVNGKRQDATLHEKFRKKYIKHKNDYYKYKAEKGSRSTDVYIE